MKTSANLRPRNRLHAAGAILRHPALDFSGPSLFDAFIGRLLDALQEETRQFCAVIRRQFGSLLIEILDGATHSAILADLPAALTETASRFTQVAPETCGRGQSCRRPQKLSLLRSLQRRETRQDLLAVRLRLHLDVHLPDHELVS